MAVELTRELIEALKASRDGELEVVDPETSRSYHIVATETHREAMDALRRQRDLEAISEGLAQMEAGQGAPLEDAFARVRAHLGITDSQ